ncbi:MAG: cupin domain-containing protein [Hyphomicrobiales bacterium]|nr:cupin domain-containing protein [Hyphomicrobiales bacterium]
MVAPVRRIVTGQAADGKSVFTHIEEIRPLRKSNNIAWHGVWGWDEVPTLPFLSEEPYEPRSIFPGDGQVRVNTIVFPPGYGVSPQVASGTEEELAAVARDEAVYAQLMAAQSPGGARGVGGMHSTDTVDLGFVHSGEITLVQDDGAEVVLRSNDILVQHGATHAWRNKGDQPCVVTFVVTGSRRISG